jgi:uncharacterized protein (UPF0248 family)
MGRFLMDLKNLLHQLQWDERFKNRQETIEITFIHRGAPTGEKSIFFSEIRKIEGKFFVYVDSRGDGAHIPFHRITRIYDMEKDAILYYHPDVPSESD